MTTPRHKPINHAPTPWHVEVNEFKGIRLRDSKGQFLGENMRLQDATFIIQAVNAHDALIEACELALQYVLAWRSEYQYPEEVNDINKIKQALKLAKGEANSDAMGAN